MSDGIKRTEIKLPKALAAGVVRIGDRDLECAVLDDQENTRVFTQQGFLLAIGRARAAKGGEGASVDGLPAFLRAKNLRPFISKDLMESTTPIIFESHKNKGRAFGYKATLLPKVCWVYHDASINGKLLIKQQHIADLCEIMLRALTNVAIEALIDEATGFQDIRARNALQKILEKYVSEEAKPWALTFDNEFYKLIFHLNQWPFDPTSVKRPSVIGHWTNDIYDRLAPGVRVELHRVVKRNDKGRPTEKLHQHITYEVHPELVAFLTAIKALMRAAPSWRRFQDLLQRAYPKVNTNLVFPFDDFDDIK
jgi:hypothetical protein